MTPTRWYLRPCAPDLGFFLIVERVDDKRGYRMLMPDRATARRRLPYLRGMVERMDVQSTRAMTAFDPVEEEPVRIWVDEAQDIPDHVIKAVTERWAANVFNNGFSSIGLDYAAGVGTAVWMTRMEDGTLVVTDVTEHYHARPDDDA